MSYFNYFSFFGLLIIPLTLPAADVVTAVDAGGFDLGGNLIMGNPTDGMEVYDDSGNFLGTWSITSGNTYAQTLVASGNRDNPGINYNGNERVDEPIVRSETAEFASFNAGSNSSDFIIVTSERLDVSVTWNLQDYRWRGRDMEDNTPSYNLSWEVTSFTDSVNELGAVSASLTSMGEGNEFGFTGFTYTSGNRNVTIPNNLTFGTSPTAELRYSGTASGQLTDKYDGTNFTLTLQTDQIRSTNAIPEWDESFDADPSDEAGRNPRGQIRVIYDPSYDYSLDYTTFTFNAVPEPTIATFLVLGLGFVMRRRR